MQGRPLDLGSLLEPVTALAMAAGERIMAIYRQQAIEVAEKADRSPLTAADMAAHEVIVGGLRRLTPAISVLSEESSAAEFSGHGAWPRFWLVDPLDGTREFLARNGEFTVNIALIEGHFPVLGVVYVPARDICYFAAGGRGAFRRRESESATPLHPTIPAATPPRVVGSRSHGGALLAAYVERLGEHEFVAVGSALKFCLVAEGNADVYPRLGPTSWWDTAAAQCVAECAGVRVVDLTGKRLSYNRGDDLLNPFFVVYADPARDWLAALPPGA